MIEGRRVRGSQRPTRSGCGLDRAAPPSSPSISRKSRTSMESHPTGYEPDRPCPSPSLVRTWLISASRACSSTQAVGIVERPGFVSERIGHVHRYAVGSSVMGPPRQNVTKKRVKTVCSAGRGASDAIGRHASRNRPAPGSTRHRVVEAPGSSCRSLHDDPAGDGRESPATGKRRGGTRARATVGSRDVVRLRSRRLRSTGSREWRFRAPPDRPGGRRPPLE